MIHCNQLHQFVGNKANLKRANLKMEVTIKQSTPNFPKNKHFLTPDTYTVLRFALLSYYQRIEVILMSSLLTFYQNKTSIFTFLMIWYGNRVSLPLLLKLWKCAYLTDISMSLICQQRCIWHCLRYRHQTSFLILSEFKRIN